MKSVKRCSYLILAIFLSISSAFAQNPISVEFLQEETAANIEAEFGIPAEFDVAFYKLTYTTPDVHGVLDTASGLIVLPIDNSNQYPMLVYQHGTINDRNTAMSNLVAADVSLATIFGSFGYITVCPDFLGVGEARGFQPYVHADTEASAALDMMRAVIQIETDDIDFHWNERTFITGYSQGGHAAMALHREVETNHSDEFDVIAAAPMSGPYSISEEMIDFTLGDEEYFFVGYLPNVAISYKLAYPELLEDIELEDIFKPEYIDDIRRFEREEIGLFDLNDILIDRLNQIEGQSVPRLMMFDNIVESMKNDPTHPLSVALADNDVYDWAPQAFTRMYYCKGDDQVTYKNATRADTVMNANGAINTLATNLSDTEDHEGCVIPAVSTTLQFFFFFRGITSSTDDLLADDQFSIYPSPAENILKVDMDPALANSYSVYRVLNLDGKVVSKMISSSARNTMDISQLQTGMYILEIEGENFRGLKRFMKL
jgi:hypothetical protein